MVKSAVFEVEKPLEMHEMGLDLQKFRKKQEIRSFFFFFFFFLREKNPIDMDSGFRPWAAHPYKE